jgi:hypothetical protein
VAYEFNDDTAGDQCDKVVPKTGVIMSDSVSNRMSRYDLLFSIQVYTVVNYYPKSYILRRIGILYLKHRNIINKRTTPRKIL